MTVDCPFELDCGNTGNAKCQVCMRIAEAREHWPAFKDKAYYAKTLPWIPNLRLLDTKTELSSFQR